MKKRFFYIIFSFLIVSCASKNESKIIERNAIIYSGDKKIEKFKIQSYKIQDTLYLKYINQVDTTRIIEIKKVANSNKLNWSNDIFKEDNKKSFSHKELNNEEFNFYVQEDQKSHMTSLLFNSDYGVLAIYNSYGPTLFFVEENDEDLMKALWGFIKK